MFDLAYLIRVYRNERIGPRPLGGLGPRGLSPGGGGSVFCRPGRVWCENKTLVMSEDYVKHDVVRTHDVYIWSFQLQNTPILFYFYI